MEEEVLAGVDSTVRERYAAFKKAVKDKSFFETADGKPGADTYFEALLKEPGLARLHSTMRRNYAAALQDDAQQAINAYMKANPTELQDRYNADRRYQLYPMYLRRAAGILGPGSLFYRLLLSKASYFEGLGLRLEAGRIKGLRRENFYYRAKAKQIEALRYDTLSPFIYNELGVLHSLLKLDERAFAYYDKAIDLSPEWGLPYINYSVGLHYAGERERSLNMGEEALKRMPDYGQAWVLLAFIHANYWDFVPGRKYSERLGLELHQNFMFNTDNYGTIAQRKLRYVKSIELLREGFRRDASCVSCLVNLGNIYRQINDPAQAERYLTQAIALDSTNAKVHRELGVLFSHERRFVAAEKYYRRAIALALPVDSVSASYWYNELGNLYKTQGNLQRAMEQYQYSLAIDSTYTHALGNLGYMLGEIGDYRQAERYLIRCARITTSKLYMLGDLYTEMQRFKEAEWMYKRAIAANPNYIYPQTKLVFLFRLTGRTVKADSLQTALLLKFPDDPGMKVSLAWQNQYHFGLYDEAEQLFFDALKQGGDTTTIYSGLGATHLRAGRLEKAREYFDLMTRRDSSWSIQSTIFYYHAFIGEDEKALDLLEKLLQQGYYGPYDFRNNPTLDKLRQTPRFRALLRQYLPEVFALNEDFLEVADTASYFAENCFQLGYYWHYRTPQDAEEAYRRAMALEPGHLPAQLSLAELLIEQGRIEEGKALLPDTLPADDARLLVLAGRIYFALEDTAKGNRYFQQASGLQIVNNWSHHTYIGNYLYYMQINPVLAIPYREKALDLDPHGDFAAVADLADAYYAAGRAAEAIALLEGRMARDTAELGYPMHAALLYLLSGDTAAFRSTLQEMEPHWPGIHRLTEFTDSLTAGNITDAERALAALKAEFASLQYSWWPVIARIMVCREHVKKGHPDTALEYLGEMLKDWPGILPHVNQDPHLAPLRNHPGYGDVKAKYFRKSWFPSLW
jgi:pentatricopeptide repeat protein